MMTKKTLALAAAVVWCASGALAQSYEPEPGLSWQAELGVNISSIRGSFDNDGSLYDMNAKAGVDIGIRGELMLPGGHGAYISFGVEWTQKGGKQKIYVERDDADLGGEDEDNNGETLPGFSGTHKVNAHYVSIPLHIGFRHNFSDDWGVFGEAGPYFGVGVSGKNKFKPDQDGSQAKEVRWNEKTFRKKTTHNESAGGFQRFDVGLGFRVGAEYMNHYSLNLAWDWGLTDMLRQDYRDFYFDENHCNADKLKNFCFSITLGYRF